MAAGSFHVSLSAFEGPFDLLLHLISRRRVDIHDIPIAQITDDYLTVLRAAERIDLDVTTDFLVVAATLVELKAARLLPDLDDPDREELAVEARDLLYARLLDYRMFRRAASWIGGELAVNEGLFGRCVPLEARFADARPPARLPVNAGALAALAAQALAERLAPRVDVSHLHRARRSVAEAADLVWDTLRRVGGRATFAQLTAGADDPSDVVAHFLAVLELYKRERVDLHQASSLGTLTVTALDVHADATIEVSS